MYTKEKKSLNLLPFYLKADTSLPSMKTGGVTGIFLPLRNVFSIDQYSFAFAIGSFKV